MEAFKDDVAHSLDVLRTWVEGDDRAPEKAAYAIGVAMGTIVRLLARVNTLEAMAGRLGLSEGAER